MVIACSTFEGQDSGSDLCEAAVRSTILNHPGKGRAQVVTANGEVVGSEDDSAASFDRASRHARSVVPADIQIAVAENLRARRAARRVLLKQNETAPTSARAAVGDQHAAIAGSRGVVEDRLAAECAADRAAIVGEGAMVRGRAVVEENEAWGYAADRRTLGGEGALARGRGVLKVGNAAAVDRARGTGEGAIARGRAIAEGGLAAECAADRAANRSEGAIACGRAV